MALDTYANLQTAVLTWLARPSDTLISGSVPDMITLFETEASMRLKTHFQETSYTFQTIAAISAATNNTTASGNNTLHFASVPAGVVANMVIQDRTTPTVIPGNTTVVSTTSTTVVMSANATGAGVSSGDTINFSQPSYALPSDFQMPRWFKITSADPINELQYATPANLDVNWNTIFTGKPLEYTIEGSNVRLGPTPDGVYTIVVDYYAKVPALSSGNTTNWLLTNYPNSYLFGTLAEAEAFLGADNEDARFSLWMQRREQAFQAISAADRQFRFGGTPLMMHTDTSNP